MERTTTAANISRAMGAWLEEEPLLPVLSAILDKCRRQGGITFGETAWIAGHDAAEAMLLAWDWKLLLPRRCMKCAEWDLRVMRFEPDEHYEMANIVKFLLDIAAESGAWETDSAVSALYARMGEPDHDKMPELVRGIVQSADRETIDADAIHGVCARTGLGDRTGAMIAILKGGGVISPKLAGIDPSLKHFSPIYEVHPALGRMER